MNQRDHRLRGRCNGSASEYNPGLLNLTGWWRASFAASPWVGVASAGASLGRDLTEVTRPPSAGAPINGYTPADFDGTNDTIGTVATLASAFLTTTNLSGWALVNVDAIDTDSGTINSNDHIVSTAATGQWGIYLRDNGAGTVTVNQRAFTGAELTVGTAFTCGTPQLVQWRADGSTIEIRVNSGAWASAAGGTISSLFAWFDLGLNPPGDQWLNGKIVDIAVSQLKFTDDTFNLVKSYINSRYGLAL